jgi:hypothetical protein
MSKTTLIDLLSLSRRNSMEQNPPILESVATLRRLAYLVPWALIPPRRFDLSCTHSPSSTVFATRPPASLRSQEMRRVPYPPMRWSQNSRICTVNFSLALAL